MGRTYVITDTHFNGRVYSHANYTDLIFENWSATVSVDDTIIHGGDIASGKFTKISQRISEMPGYKILVRGNHDCSKDERYLEAFQEVYSTYVKDNVVYSHFPVNPEIYNCAYNVFGHFHRYPQNMKDSLVQRYKDFYKFEKNFTYCIEDWEFRPVDVEEFIKKCSEHAKSCV